MLDEWILFAFNQLLFFQNFLSCSTNCVELKLWLKNLKEKRLIYVQLLNIHASQTALMTCSLEGAHFNSFQLWYFFPPNWKTESYLLYCCRTMSVQRHRPPTADTNSLNPHVRSSNLQIFFVHPVHHQLLLKILGHNWLRRAAYRSSGNE